MKHFLTLWLCSGVLMGPLMAQKATPALPNAGATFLMIHPDVRSSGTGDATTGLEADVNSQFGNAAKLVYAGDWGVSASYSPWMWEMNTTDQRSNLGYLSAFKSFHGGNEAVGVSMRYFSHGDINFRDENGALIQKYHPKEFAIDASYARKLGEHMSLAVTLRYVHSDLGQGSYNGMQQQPARAVAGDIGLYSQNYAKYDPAGNRYCWGISFSNLGSKLKYTDNGTRTTFLPMNLRIGGGYSFVNTDGHLFTLLADISKLLVPSAPIYKLDNSGMPTEEIIEGKDPNRSVPSAIFSSFGDAPGGFKEELKEFTAAAGLEYSYYRQLFIRAGYFYENPSKGYRQHFSAGFGARIKNMGLDLAYIMPTANSLYQRRTLKVSVIFTKPNK
jgi:hypothetical protein